MTKTVLLVDDSASFRELIKVYLMGRDIRFLVAGNGFRALHLARVMDIDLAIVDVRMPGMDGIAFVKELRANQPPAARRVPVVLISGESAGDLEARCMEAGADAFLTKPITAEPIRALYRDLVESGV